MRTTVTLDPDTAELVRRRMRETGQSFKEAVNASIRAGASASATPFQTRARSMGVPRVDLDRALRLAADLEDDELGRRADRGA